MTKIQESCERTPDNEGMGRRDFLRKSVAAGVGLTAAAQLSAGGAQATVPDTSNIPLITLEEHFTTPELQSKNTSGDKRLFSGGGSRPELLDVGAGRIADMDEAGIDIQVLSTVTPGASKITGAEGVEFTRKFNTWIAEEVIAAYPNRFRAFATLPLSSPEAAADELERSVREYGFVGTMTYGPIDGKFLDHTDYAPLLARAEALGVPIYIHPNWPSPTAMQAYYDGLGDDLTSRILSGPGYGWHQEIAVQCLRLIVGGVFDRYPNLQIVVGHMGEGLPFYYWRVGEDLDRIAQKRLQKPVQQYFHDNLWITTSAFFRDELLNLALATMGEDRVMFSVDYPMASAKVGADWLRAADIPLATKEKIGSKNAMKLLGIDKI
ncbi:amidohydrolase family protein [Pseudovibrio sp. FO-BEG1]|uniref:amidohydrolase family protein n=1 Tax=Pseudovibrio sp. (strain FO-BEG1) TaxID=911045 RepID=UPI001FCB2251|nr:amidohydrolase family protein [Pseudovibrio sp. FO-BEG1]